MEPGAQGPAHHFDREQVWTVLEGAAVVDLAGDRLEVGPGDALVLPADVVRRITADAERGLRALACAPAGARATDGDGVDRGVPPWIA
jgi:quercetin dioxygenase-like cupin family protein